MAKHIEYRPNKIKREHQNRVFEGTAIKGKEHIEVVLRFQLCVLYHFLFAFCHFMTFFFVFNYDTIKYMYYLCTGLNLKDQKRCIVC